MTQPPPLLIADVERTTNVPRATLRVWEQRYGFPKPGRSSKGQRIYPHAQVQQLRLIHQLIRNGHRPSKVVPLSAVERAALMGKEARRASVAFSSDPVLRLIREHDTEGLLQRLRVIAAELGMERFIAQLGLIGDMLGEAWQGGQLEIFELHAYTEVAESVLRHSLLSLPILPRSARPRVLLTTIANEGHGAALLMAQGLFALEGCHCVSLGVQVPVEQVVSAAAAYGSDIVALSFSAAANTRRLTSDLRQLRTLLPAAVEIWVGGSAPVLSRQPVPGVKVFTSLEEIRPAVELYRRR